MDPEERRQQQQMLQQMKQQIAIANAQELLYNMSTKCFQKCVTRPRESLDAQEKKCIGMCMDRFMESYRLVSHTYGHRLQRERNRMH
ncbi:mitochondrial import inner membrane translocase subunit Tim13-like [Scaptodrosophila lebanonensis]|uniref:Mitochondrial import inner membrane translocase subunit n=1 Tax=Drosophila lebanonensis TaxID=7225 RepID=A0A6J2TXN0_DROLE|nr:mitochondrial import inner membrane translocase subunit Tim13-like [Scaptodrosophila lebanonensis]